MVLVIRSSKNRALSIAINKNQHLIKKIMLNFLNIRGQGVDFQNFNFFSLSLSKIEPPPHRGGENKICRTSVIF